MSATPSKINRLKESLLSSAAKMAVVAARLTPSYNSLPTAKPGDIRSSRMNSELKQAFQEISRRIVHLRDSL
jgi:hypothetical protein